MEEKKKKDGEEWNNGKNRSESRCRSWTGRVRSKWKSCARKCETDRQRDRQQLSNCGGNGSGKVEVTSPGNHIRQENVRQTDRQTSAIKLW